LEFGLDGKTLDKFLKNADRALYFAKANGRSCVIPYSADLFEKRDTTLIARVDQQQDK
jgi:predicted signal transduction protein with EAL and GGDEF domain